MRLFDSLRKLFTKAALSQAQETVSVFFGQRTIGSGGGNVSFREAAADGYKQLLWLYLCIRKLGEAMGSVPWLVEQRLPDNSIQPLPGHPLARLLNSPNPYTSRSEFFEAWVAYLKLAGNSYVEVVYVQGKPYHLYMHRPDWMEPRPDPLMFIKDYKLEVPGSGKQPIYFKPGEIIHFKYLDPTNPYVGMSPITALRRTMAAENSAVTWNQTLLENSAIPSGILKVPAVVLQNSEKQTLLRELQASYTGLNMHQPMVLWGGMEWEKMSLSHSDMSFVEQRRLNKYEQCALMGVPPQLVGANENPTYSNFATARLSFWEDTITTLLNWFATYATYRLAPFWGDNIEVRYDLSGVPAMREAYGQKIKSAESLWRMGFPINDINAKLQLGMEKVAWGDVAWANASMVPLGAVLPEPTEEPKPNETDPYTGDPLEEDPEPDEDSPDIPEAGD